MTADLAMDAFADSRVTIVKKKTNSSTNIMKPKS